MDKSKGNTLLLLVAPEDELIGLALAALQDAARRIDQGHEAPSDAGTMRLCREIVRAVERCHDDRQETTLAMIANTMEPAAA